MSLAASGSTYSYDAADELTQITAGSVSSSLTTTSLTYDAGNEITSYQKVSGSTTQQSYTYDFDPNGNRIDQKDQLNGGALVTSYGYDQANRLTSYGTAATYAYNGDGLRMSKTLSLQTTQQVWDMVGGLPTLLQDGSTQYIPGADGLPLEQITSAGAVYYYHQDESGSTRAMTDGSGSVAQTYAYDAYGNQTSSSGAISNPLRYAGQYFDAESGLYYLRARYYDPVTVQFLQRDPKVEQTREPYSYAVDNPINRGDPSGLCSTSTKADCDAITQALSLSSIGLNILSAIFDVVGDVLDATGGGAIVGIPLNVLSLLAEAGATVIDIGQCVRGQCDWLGIGLDVVGLVPILGFVGSSAKILIKSDKLLATLEKVIKDEPKMMKAIDHFSNNGGIIQGFFGYLADCWGIGPESIIGVQ